MSMKLPHSSPSKIAHLALLLCGLSVALPVLASTEDDPHAAHRAMMAEQNKAVYKRSTAEYSIPAISLTDMHGKKVTLDQVISGDTPIMLNFIFTTCGTICPVMSVTFSQAQEMLNTGHDKIKMISISVDPEYDTPKRLREYANRFKAGDNWYFLTGSVANSIAAQEAFQNYRGNKMNHAAVTFLRANSKSPWVRLDGFASAKDLVSEYHRILHQ